jgi:phosphatidylserine/phosphatidylglycerophosphate/cardiolipin synthase-like enzyme
LLEAGVELYEMKPYRQRVAQVAPGRDTRLGRRIQQREPAREDLHLSIGGRAFIGSYNLDPRSSKLNTEMGVVFDLPELVAQIPVALSNAISNAMPIASNSTAIAWYG